MTDNDLGRVGDADRAGGPADPSPPVSAKGAHPSRGHCCHCDDHTHTLLMMGRYYTREDMDREFVRADKAWKRLKIRMDRAERWPRWSRFLDFLRLAFGR